MSDSVALQNLLHQYGIYKIANIHILKINILSILYKS